jgi:hypothetical protein
MKSEKELERQIRDATDLEQLTQSLQELLSSPCAVWPNGQLICIKVLIERINDLRVEIRPRDHPPPHFHIIGPNFNVSFEIESGDLLEGQIDPPHFQKIKWWHNRARAKLNAIWDNTRPTG